MYQLLNVPLATNKAHTIPQTDQDYRSDLGATAIHPLRLVNCFRPTYLIYIRKRVGVNKIVSSLY